MKYWSEWEKELLEQVRALKPKSEIQAVEAVLKVTEGLSCSNRELTHISKKLTNRIIADLRGREYRAEEALEEHIEKEAQRVGEWQQPSAPTPTKKKRWIAAGAYANQLRHQMRGGCDPDD